MRPVFLIGGGRDARGIAASHRPFVQATGGGPICCLVADEGDGIDALRWVQGLRIAGARTRPRTSTRSHRFQDWD